MTRVIAHEAWLKTLDKVTYHKYLGGGYWLADIELHLLCPGPGHWPGLLISLKPSLEAKKRT